MVPPRSVKIPISSVSIFIFQTGCYNSCAINDWLMANAPIVNAEERRNDLRFMLNSYYVNELLSSFALKQADAKEYNSTRVRSKTVATSY
jgi:hypothetical protein